MSAFVACLQECRGPSGKSGTSLSVVQGPALLQSERSAPSVMLQREEKYCEHFSIKLKVRPGCHF